MHNVFFDISAVAIGAALVFAGLVYLEEKFHRSAADEINLADAAIDPVIRDAKAAGDAIVNSAAAPAAAPAAGSANPAAPAASGPAAPTA